MRVILKVLAGCLAIAACQDPAGTTAALPRLGASVSDVTLSGVSSGAYMAAQYQFAHARTVRGVGLVAGGLFACVESADNPFVHIAGVKAVQAVEMCMKARYRAWGLPDARQLARLVRRLATSGDIDPVSDISGDRVYVFTGARDTRVATDILDSVVRLYGQLGVSDGDILYERNRLEAAHAFIVEDGATACGVSEKPFLADCDYDQAGAILQHLLGSLNAPSGAAGDFATFDQSEFTEDLAAHGLAGEGVIYVPSSCAESTGCRLHIVLHGCGQNRESVADAFIRGSGFARWAASNRLILLFPQTSRSAGSEKGCWDWWGYTGPDYHTRKAPQIRALHRMIARLGSEPS